MKRYLLIGVFGLLLCVWFLLFLLVNCFGPANPVAHKIAYACAESISKSLTSPRMARVTPFMSYGYCSYSIAGGVDIDGADKIFIESGLYQFYGTIEISGVSSSGDQYSVVLKGAKKSEAPSQNQ